MAEYSSVITLENAAHQVIEIANYPTSTTIKNAPISDVLIGVNFWIGTDAGSLAVDRSGVISGTVKVLGVLQNKSRVSLYYRKTGALIQSTTTDKNGEFSFQCGLNRNVSDYYAVAITDQPFNAQIFDKLTPA